MSLDNPRIEELRRRVQKDPASIAFAQLAEEHRRAGEYEEAIRVCRAGLGQHPGYLSARVTLARALIEVGRLDEAQIELDHVLTTAPDNLAAARALADIHHRRGVAAGVGERWDVAVAILDSIVPALPRPTPEPSTVYPEPAISDPGPRVPDPKSRILNQLESWLAAIVADRARRRP